MKSRIRKIQQCIQSTLIMTCAVPMLWLPIVPAAHAQGLPDIDGTTSEGALPYHLEQRLGEIIRGQARNDRSFIADYDLYDYLNQMATRLAKGTDVKNLSVFPLRDPVVNAFAMPGGVIGIHSGLFVKAQTESELAGVMAHEIGHIKHRHVAQKIGQQADGTLLMIASILGAIAASGQGGGASMGVLMFGQAAAVDKTLAFSRYAESDADREGFAMLTAAGYDPKGMATFFGRLAQIAHLNEMGPQTFATTHPLATQRMVDMENRIQQLPAKNIENSLDFYLLQSLLIVEQTMLDSKLPEVLQQFEGRVRTETSKTAQLAAQFGVVRSHIRARHWSAAEPALETLQNMARTMGVKHALIDRSAIEIALGQDQAERALQLSNKAQQQWGTRMSLILLRLQALASLGHHAEMLKESAKLPYSVPEVYRLQSMAYERLNQPMQARIKNADYYQALSMTTAAIQQLQEALKYATLFQDKAILDVRIKELMQRRKEEDELKKKFS